MINYWKVPEGPGHRHQGHQVVPGEPRTMDSGERHTGMNDMNLMYYKYHDWQRYPILLLLILHRWCILSETQGASLAHGPRLCGLKSSCRLQFFVDRCKRIWPWLGVYHLTGENGIKLCQIASSQNMHHPLLVIMRHLFYTSYLLYKFFSNSSITQILHNRFHFFVEFFHESFFQIACGVNCLQQTIATITD